MWHVLRSGATEASGAVAQVTDKAYFDVTVGDDTTNTSRIVIGLFGEIVPETVNNFKMLVRNEKGYGFQGTNFYRIVKDLQISGGDVLKNAGKSGKSAINGDVFPQVSCSRAYCFVAARVRVCPLPGV